MDEKWSLRVEFEAQAKNLLSTVEQIIGSLGDLQSAAEGDTAKALDKLERELNGAAKGARDAAGAMDQAATASDKSAKSAKTNATAIQELQKQYDGLANTRYALYDVARTWTVVAGATTGALLAVEGVGASYEHAFADVSRTFDGTQKQTDKLRQDLKYLTQEIPESFGTLAEVATLAGQLDIAAGNIASFTETVVMFAATTDVTAENAAMSLGRLIQLTDASQAQSENLAAAIYETGVNSVATEGQILSMANQLATTGDLAGFTASEIVGLSSALASMGVAPERARGVFIRVFGNLNRAVGQSGDELLKYARVAGMSADEFADAWQNRPEQAFRALMHGMEDVARSGQNLTSTMDELGIRNVREVEVLERLANNMNIYVATQDDANRAFAEGTALQEGFNERTDTLISSLTILRNTVGSIMDNISNSNLLKPVVDSINNVLVVIDKLTESPIARWIATITGGLVAGVAGFAIYQAAIYRARASVAGLMQSKIALNTQNVNLRGGLFSLGKAYFTLTAQINEATAATAANTAATATNTGAANANAIAKRSQGMADLTANTTGAAGALSSFGNMAKGALRFLGPIGIGLGVAHFGFGLLSDGIRESREEAERLDKAVEGMKETLVADQGSTTFYREISVEVEKTSKSQVDWQDVLAATTGAQRELRDATGETNDAIEEQRYQVAEATKERWEQLLLGDESFVNAMKAGLESGDFEEMGFDVSTAIVKGLEGGESLDQYLAETRQKFIDTFDFPEDVLENPLELRNFKDGLGQQFDIATRDVESFLRTLIEGTEKSAHEMAVLEGVARAMGVELEETSDAAYTFSEAMADAFAQTDRIVDTENAIHNLTQAFYDNGAGLNLYSAEGRANMGALQSAIEAIYNSNAPEQANAIAMGILANLEAQGLATQQELTAARNLVASMSQGVSVSEDAARYGRLRAYQAMDQAFTDIGNKSAPKAASAIKNKGKEAAKAAKEVRTLTDYVRDLDSVFSSAFDIRFGLDISTDDLADEFEDMVKWAEDAARSVRDITQRINELNATITGLRASNNTLEYQLRVAREYGDELREQEILAEIAKNNADIAKTQHDRADASKDLKKAQDQTNKSLSGNTRGSREQRGQVLSLVQAYQNQVKELANTNLSQEELERRTDQLKRAFEDQLRTLGYAPSEIQRYSAAFDDMTVAIQKVPRNVTVNANVSPGQRAVNEFLARINKSKATVNVTANAPKSVTIPVNPRWLNTKAIATDLAIQGAVTARKGMTIWESVVGRKNLTVQQGIIAGGREMVSWRSQGGPIEYRASGGVSGLHPGHPKGSDTVPAWLTPGEYVHNKKAVSYYGLPFMNALNNMQMPRYLATGGSAATRPGSGSASGIMQAELSIGDRRFFAQLFQNMQVVVDGRTLGRVVQNQSTQSARGGNA